MGEILELMQLGRLHPIPATAWAHEESHIVGMDRRAIIWAHHAADCWGHFGQLEIEMGQEAAVHDRRIYHRGAVSPRTRLDG